MIPSFAYLRARNVAEAVAHLGPARRPLAGGTDLLGCLRDGAMAVDEVVSLSHLEELTGLAVDDDGALALGALTTIDELTTSHLVRRHQPLLAAAAAEVASPQLRHQGTLAGNLCQRPRCWYFRGDFRCLKKGGETCFAFAGENQNHCLFGGGPCYIVHPSDTAPALLALDATAVVVGPGGQRSLPLAELYHLPARDLDRETTLATDEIITRLRVPAMAAHTVTRFRKVRARRAWDFALASAALALTFAGPRVTRARVVLGGVAPVPWRVPQVERLLEGSDLSETTIARAAVAATEGADPLARNRYKIGLVRGLIREELRAIAGAGG